MYAVREEVAVRMRSIGPELEGWEDARITPQPRPFWPRLVREAVVEHAYGASAADALEAAPDDPSITDPDDELFLLGERCAEAYLQADVLQYRAMRLLAEFHDREGWRDTGFTSTAEWLAWRIGIKPGAARERLRTALALENLPETAEAM